MCYDNGDSADVWVERERSARKSRECAECGAPIPIGRRYVDIRMLYDGTWDRFPVHTECLELWRFVRDVVCGGQGSIMIGGLSEEISAGIVDEHGFGLWLDDDTRTNPLESVFDEIRDTYRSLAWAPARP